MSLSRRSIRDLSICYAPFGVVIISLERYQLTQRTLQCGEMRMQCTWSRTPVDDAGFDNDMDRVVGLSVIFLFRLLRIFNQINYRHRYR